MNRGNADSPMTRPGDSSDTAEECAMRLPLPSPARFAVAGLLALAAPSLAFAQAADTAPRPADPGATAVPQGDVLYCRSMSDVADVTGVRSEPSGFPAQCPSGYEPFEPADSEDFGGAPMPRPGDDGFTSLPERRSVL